MTLVALVTCAELPDLDPDDRLLIEPLAALGVTVEAAVWDDPAVDWTAHDLAVLRSPWDYARQRDAFVAWAHTVPRLANPAPVVEWNTDKRYLAELAAAGVPVVPTTVGTPGEGVALADHGEWVIKPTVSAGSRDTGRYDLGEPDQVRLARRHVDRLLAAGRAVMVQPYLAAVDVAGETALLYLDGRFSHAIRKGALLTGPDQGDVRLYRPETITAREASAAEREVADQVLAAVPWSGLAYARVDLIPGPDGAPVLLELELTEPSLFLGHSDGAPARAARAIAAALGRGRS